MTHERNVEAREEGIRQMQAIMDNPGLSDREKARLRRKLIDDQRDVVANIMIEKENMESRHEALTCVLDWGSGELDSYRLERNDCSRLHKLLEAGNSGQLLNAFSDGAYKGSDAAFAHSRAEVFIVSHDWAAAFGDAITSFDDEFNLPYPHCAFEFRINGKTVIAIGLQPDGGKPNAAWFVEVSANKWVFVTDEGGTGFGFAWQQVKAICIALDAEVATRELVRAPSALNKKRIEQNKAPIFSYHVVNLAKRYRTTPADESTPTGVRRRLHFRRGHWRHFETHKTWIKWMLVGDPALGFIDKHYKL